MTPDRFIIFDTETDGVAPDREACDIGMMEINPVTLEEIGRCESLIKISKPIPPAVTEIHGITDEMLKDAPTIEEWVDATFGLGGLDGKVALIGHRIDFDLPMFAPIGEVSRFANGDPMTVDTLLLTQLFLQVQTENRKLDTLKEALGLPGGGQSHRAMADVVTAHQLLQHLMPLTGRSLVDIAMTEKFMIHEMPWGKHEGKLLVNVPRQYRQWLLDLDGLDRHLRYSLEQVALADIPLPPPRAPGSAGSLPVRRLPIYIPPRRTQ